MLLWFISLYSLFCGMKPVVYSLLSICPVIVKEAAHFIVSPL